MKRPNIAKLQKQVDDWNAKYPVGTSVTVKTDLGEVIATKTKHPAQVLSGHSAVIWCHGISGCYDLSRVSP